MQLFRGWSKMPRSDKGYSRGITASEDLALPVRARGGWGEGASLRASRSPHLDARRPKTREEAYLNGTLTKRVYGQRRIWAFFTSPIRVNPARGLEPASKL